MDNKTKNLLIAQNNTCFLEDIMWFFINQDQ
jgi:hypothetical protein